MPKKCQRAIVGHKICVGNLIAPSRLWDNTVSFPLIKPSIRAAEFFTRIMRRNFISNVAWSIQFETCHFLLGVQYTANTNLLTIYPIFLNNQNGHFSCFSEFRQHLSLNLQLNWNLKCFPQLNWHFNLLSPITCQVTLELSLWNHFNWRCSCCA